jgi:hypothetical protein
MRKSVVEAQPAQTNPRTDEGWLDLERIATVEVTSEDPAYPIESAFANSGGWRAAHEGRQVIRLIFDKPQTFHRIWLRFSETEVTRTQEFVLRAFSWGVKPFREIVRQQWNFSPDGSTEETEDYQVELKDISALELSIQPDITSGKAIASLAGWRVA